MKATILEKRNDGIVVYTPYIKKTPGVDQLFTAESGAENSFLHRV